MHHKQKLLTFHKMSVSAILDFLHALEQKQFKFSPRTKAVCLSSNFTNTLVNVLENRQLYEQTNILEKG